VDSDTTKYFLDGADVIADFDGDDVLQATYVTPGLDDNISQTRSGSTYYYLQDGLGSIRNLVDSNEATQNTYDYYAFGKELGSWTENVTNRYTYTAREYDEESEQYYYRTRLYNGAGRFLSRDIVEMHRYVYVSNRPLMLVDAYGLYGRETHLKLTAAMAEYAGFTPSVATAIGTHNNEVDKYHDAMDLYDEAVTAINQVRENGWDLYWVQKGFLAELEILRWHFPQKIGDKRVEENSPIARDRVKAWIERCNYKGFAKALHVFQDSYAHASEGPLPLGYFITGSYGHSWARRGSLGEFKPEWSTDADRPWLRPVLARRMARESYALIVEFVENCHCDHRSWFEPRKWPPRPFEEKEFVRFWTKPQARAK
jgi:RHS repeat-associated protein